MRFQFAFLLSWLFCMPSVAGTVVDDAVFTRISSVDGLSDNHVQHILQLPDGRMAFTTLGNINLYDGWRFRYIHRSDEAVCPLKGYSGAYHVYIDSNDRLWVKKWRHLWCLDLRHEAYVRQPSDIFRQLGLSDEVTDLFVDGQKKLWLVTEKGLWDTEQKRYLAVPVRPHVLLDLACRDGRLYLFYDNGEVICHDLKADRRLYAVAAYSQEEILDYRGSSLVVEGPDGCFYQVCDGRKGGVFAFNPETRSWRRLLTTPYILHTLIVPSEEYAYVTCGKGLWTINLLSGETVYHPALKMADGEMQTASINTIFQDRQGGIWLGTYNQGLLYTHPRRFRFRSAEEAASLGLDAGTVDSLLAARRRGSGDFTVIYADTCGRIWNGTPDGLRLQVPGDTANYVYYTEDGLSNNYIHGITEDNEGYLWLSTGNGLSRVDVSQAPRSVISTNYNWTDGTLKGEYNDGMAFTLADGRIVMQGVDGWTLFHPDSIITSGENFRPVLVGMSLHGRSLVVGRDSVAGRPVLPQQTPYVDHFELDWRNNTLSFVFSALNYAFPGQTCYRYRLVCDKDSAWHVVRPGAAGLIDANGILHLSFVHLAPGKYRLQTMAATHPTDWNGPVTTLTFNIRAPWWRTRLAYAAYAVMFLLILSAAFYGYYRISRHRLMQRHREEILLLRIKNLIERCDAYEQQTVCDEVTKEQPQTLSENDAQFLNKAVAMVEQHLNVPGYSVEQLSKDLCMERTGLYKKLTAMLDKSPSLFIRSIRLKRAAALLLEGRLTVTEIAEQVGFSSASYMGKCFYEEYGCKPSEYQRRQSSVEQD